MRNETFPTLRVALLAGSFALLAGLLPAPAVSQEIRGRVVEGNVGAPLEGAELLLLHDGDSVVTSATTDAEGRFVLTPFHPATYSIYAAPDEVGPVRTAGIRVRLAETVEVEIRVRPSDPTADPLTVVASRRQVDRLADEMRDFRRRTALDREEGAGRVLARETLAATPWLTVGTYSRSRLQDEREACRPVAFVDGRSGPAIEDWIGATSVAELAGLEYHPGAGLAGSRFTDPEGCGVLLAWTRDWDANRIFTWERFATWAAVAGLSLLLMR